MPETLQLEPLLDRMQTERLHVVGLIDEFGGVSGIVTLEDVLEALVGELRDEFDAGEKPPIVAVSETEFLVAGDVLIQDLERALGLELSDRDEDTVGGVVLAALGRRPRRGDRAELGPASLEVIEVERGHVARLRIVLAKPVK